MEQIKIKNLFNIDETIAKALLEKVEYPWECITKISDFILELGSKLDLSLFEKRGEDVWIAKSAVIEPMTFIKGPTIIDENAQIRHSAYIRGNAIVGKNSVVGNSVELKNCILFNNTQVPHYNYIGDSILGYKVHMGAGSITSNLKSDGTNVSIKFNDIKIDTGLRKIGAIIGDCSEIGCNSVLNPGSIIGKNTSIYPLCSVRGVVPENQIYKNKDNIIPKI